ncbi:MAG: polyphosphate kinase 1 [Alphaproteobacteria bacterium]|nr:polyphosphate kinase 1 [Alphaproteobacteria bacterium]
MTPHNDTRTFTLAAPRPVPTPAPAPVSPAVTAGANGVGLYLNRELSWLNFNQRVLNEAADPRTPLLEALKFLAIAYANLDEFYMKRIGGLKHQIAAGVTALTVDGRTPHQQLRLCSAEMARFQIEIDQIHETLMVAMGKHEIIVENCRNLNDRDRRVLRKKFSRQILPLLTPIAIDPARRFPFVSNLSLNLIVALNKSTGPSPQLARIKIPDATHVPQFLHVGPGHRYVGIADVISNNLDLIFPGLEVVAGLFRITRNAITRNDPNGAADLLEMIAGELRDRKFAPVVRLQTSPDVSSEIRAMLAGKLGLIEAEDVFVAKDMVALGALMELAGLNLPKLRHPPHRPVDNAALGAHRDIFTAIQTAGSILLQHPYEAFVTSVKRFVREASRDADVLSIKMTLYRTSADTRFIDYLIAAAQNGKQVAVVVELQARFDEAANIAWARRLEDAGIHVNYGVLGVKTHCKTILVVRREGDRLRRYAHFGTGNYHAGTALLYSDVGLLTCDEILASDLTELFNHLTTRWRAKRGYAQILAAPMAIKNAILTRIEREIDLHSPKSPGLVRLKTNALEDVDITDALYAASRAGVKVELLVRDICRLRPGVPGLSENITVTSIVGRFLEHARIYYFRNAGDDEFFIGSADLMRRNLERRVEVIVPVRDAPARRLLAQVLQTQLDDTRNAWVMNSDGSYTRRQPAKTGARATIGSQEHAIRAARKRQVRPVSTRKSFARNTGMGA